MLPDVVSRDSSLSNEIFQSQIKQFLSRELWFFWVNISKERTLKVLREQVFLIKIGEYYGVIFVRASTFLAEEYIKIVFLEYISAFRRERK